jgi:hypothetical protein
MQNIARHLGRQIIRVLDIVFQNRSDSKLDRILALADEEIDAARAAAVTRGVDRLLAECIAKVGLPCYVCDGAHWTHDPVGVRPAAVRAFSGLPGPRLAVIPADRKCATAMYGEDRLMDWPPTA